MAAKKIIGIKNLAVAHGEYAVLNDVTMSLQEGETVCLVGESGSGKTMLSLAVMGLLPPVFKITKGSITYFDGDAVTDLVSLESDGYSRVRGKKIAMIFQDPLTSLNPVLTCGRQVDEVTRIHSNPDNEAAKQKTIELFRQVNLEEAERIYASYPHQLSGGQLQRVMISMALAGNPKILIADEPTSSLDVPAQSSLVQLLKKLKEELNLSMLFITHDLGLAKNFADRVIVLRQGKIMEEGPAVKVLVNPANLYTRELLESRITSEKKQVALFSETTTHPLLEVQDISVCFKQDTTLFTQNKKKIMALSRISFTVYEGETLGIVGPSGSGKSTLARVLVKLVEPDEGEVFFNGMSLKNINRKETAAYRKKVQLVFQDADSSLNPKLTVGESIESVIRLHPKKGDSKHQTHQLLEQVELPGSFYSRYPSQLSSGQRQRVNIARTLALKPRVLICDEPVSSLDASVQAQVLTLLNNLKQTMGITLIIISHDPHVIYYMSDRILILNEGRVEETGSPGYLLQHAKTNFGKQVMSVVRNYS